MIRAVPAGAALFVSGEYMSRRLLDYDPASGLKEWFTYDEANDSFAITYEQDVTSVLDANKAEQAEGFDRRNDVWHAARVPVGIQYEWLVKHGVNIWNKNHREGVKRLLNDPEYRWLRVKHFIM